MENERVKRRNFRFAGRSKGGNGRLYLKTLNLPDPEIEQAWKKEVQRRKKQVETDEVKLIPGEQFDKEVQEIKKPFSE